MNVRFAATQLLRHEFVPSEDRTPYHQMTSTLCITANSDATSAAPALRRGGDLAVLAFLIRRASPACRTLGRPKPQPGID